MPLEFFSGNIFESGADALVNPVNCVGVMGAGLAAQFRQRYPAEMFDGYRDLCWKGDMKPGSIHIYQAEELPHVIFVPTKQHWMDRSSYDTIDLGLRLLRQILLSNQEGYDTVAVPPIGCGLGGLDWNIVSIMISKYLNDVDVYVKVYRKED